MAMLSPNMLAGQLLGGGRRHNLQQAAPPLESMFANMPPPRSISEAFARQQMFQMFKQQEIQSKLARMKQVNPGSKVLASLPPQPLTPGQFGILRGKLSVEHSKDNPRFGD